MSSFLNTHNGTSLTGITDLTAHSISIFQENELPKNINDIFIPNCDISIAEPYDVIIDELSHSVITMCQFIGDINDTKVGGLESLLNYMKTSSVRMSQLLMNIITALLKRNKMKKQIIFTMSIEVNLIISKINRYTDEHYDNKQQFITNNITNYITKKIVELIMEMF